MICPSQNDTEKQPIDQPLISHQSLNNMNALEILQLLYFIISYWTYSKDSHDERFVLLHS